MPEIVLTPWKRYSWLWKPYVFGVVLAFPVALLLLNALYTGVGPFKNLDAAEAARALPGMWITVLLLCPMVIPLFLSFPEEKGLEPKELVTAILKVVGFSVASLVVSAWVLRSAGALVLALTFHQFLLAFQLLLIGFFVLLRGVGVSGSTSQLATSGLGVFMTATVLLSNSALLLAGEEHRKWVIDITVWANPVIVASHSFMKVDLFRMQPLYGFSKVHDYHFLYPAWTTVAAIYGGAGAAFLAVGSLCRVLIFTLPKQRRLKKQEEAIERREAEEAASKPPTPVLGPSTEGESSPEVLETTPPPGSLTVPAKPVDDPVMEEVLENAREDRETEGAEDEPPPEEAAPAEEEPQALAEEAPPGAAPMTEGFLSDTQEGEAGVEAEEEEEYEAGQEEQLGPLSIDQDEPETPADEPGPEETAEEESAGVETESSPAEAVGSMMDGWDAEPETPAHEESAPADEPGPEETAEEEEAEVETESSPAEAVGSMMDGWDADPAAPADEESAPADEAGPAETAEEEPTVEQGGEPEDRAEELSPSQALEAVAESRDTDSSDEEEAEEVEAVVEEVPHDEEETGDPAEETPAPPQEEGEEEPAAPTAGGFMDGWGAGLDAAPPEGGEAAPSGGSSWADVMGGGKPKGKKTELAGFFKEVDEEEEVEGEPEEEED
ncbi:MAG: hypothetical protein ACYTFG_07405 [Planctomycetota bacterium]|jgi:hypothetical protein